MPFTVDNFGADGDKVPPPPGNRHKSGSPWYVNLVRGGYKYIRPLEAYQPEELYDLSADPVERTNLARTPEQAARLQQLRAAAFAEQRRTGAKMVDSLPSVPE
jgi:arylsulfatase A-like enzyme